MTKFKYNQEVHDRQSIRLKGYDYSLPGFYFVTICLKDGQHHFGDIIDKGMHLSLIGKITQKCLLKIPEHYPNVVLNEFVVMPNHLHGIIEIIYSAEAPHYVRAQNLEPVQNEYQRIIPKSLGSIIRGFKIGVTKWCRQNGYKYFKWHRNFYDHIICESDDIENIKQYIINNPVNWKRDRNNSENLFM